MQGQHTLPECPMPRLYLVATPIGNLEDITLRALRVLREVGLIAAEDTRTTRRLLRRYEIDTPVTSYHEHNRQAMLPRLLAALVEKDVALVSDAGTPGISDPGCELVEACWDAGVQVVPVPGASAVTAALAAAGVNADRFLFAGFPPRKRGARRALLESLAAERRPLVLFEAPHRLLDTLADLDEFFADRRVVVCRELTKLHEEVFGGTASEALGHFREPRGEFTLVIEGGVPADESMSRDAAARLASQLRAGGESSKESIARIMEETGVGRRQAYRIWLESGEKA